MASGNKGEEWYHSYDLKTFYHSQYFLSVICSICFVLFTCFNVNKHQVCCELGYLPSTLPPVHGNAGGFFSKKLYSYPLEIFFWKFLVLYHSLLLFSFCYIFLLFFFFFLCPTDLFTCILSKNQLWDLVTGCFYLTSHSALRVWIVLWCFLFVL